MKPFKDHIIETMVCYDHSHEFVASTLKMRVPDFENITAGTSVPSWDWVKEFCELYHLDAEELRQAWLQAKKEHTEQVRRMDRQFHARQYLMEHLNTASSIPARQMCVIAASQFFHNVYSDPDNVSEDAKTIIKMRSIFSYDMGGEQEVAYSEQLGDDNRWKELQNSIIKAIL